jgi:hypothetical protein
MDGPDGLAVFVFQVVFVLVTVLFLKIVLVVTIDEKTYFSVTVSPVQIVCRFLRSPALGLSWWRPKKLSTRLRDEVVGEAAVGTASADVGVTTISTHNSSMASESAGRVMVENCKSVSR